MYLPNIIIHYRFVDPKLDDDEGNRQLDAIQNIHGIVKFEYQYSRNADLANPPGEWNLTTQFAETQTIIENMSSGIKQYLVYSLIFHYCHVH